MYKFFFSAWLEGEDDPVVDRVNLRIQDITGLTVDTAELLQVINRTTLNNYVIVSHITQKLNFLMKVIFVQLYLWKITLIIVME